MFWKQLWFMAILLVGFCGCGDRPDLEVAKIESMGAPRMNSGGDIELPIRIIIGNRSDASATRFHIVVEYLLPQGTFEAPFIFSGVRFEKSECHVTPLRESGEVEVFGKVVFPERHYGWTAVVKARVTCCDPETVLPTHTHQEESYTDNNESWPIQIVLATETVSLK